MDLLKLAYITKKKIEKAHSLGQISASKLPHEPVEEYKMRMAFFTKITDMLHKIDVWKEYGCKTFHLTSRLLDAFKNTDLPKDITINQIPRPFDSFVIESDTSLFKSSQPGGFLVNVYKLLYTEDSLLFKNQKDAKMHTKVVEMHDFKIEDCVGTLHSLNVGVHNVIDGGVVIIKRDTVLNNIPATLAVHRPDDEERVKCGLMNSINLLFNTILYINDNSRSVVETETHVDKRSRNSGGGYVKKHYIYLRRPIRARNNDDKYKRVINARFRVRGHWRMQPYGEGRLLRMSKWIPPFWKGPSTAEIVSNPHKVD